MRDERVPPNDDRVARLQAALPRIHVAIEGERDAITLQATLACLLFETLRQASWCGFYRRISDTTLAVGPYQGPFGCLRIELDRGVCGKCARTGEVQRVADVHAFEGHIACDAGARSEVVIPVVVGSRVRAVLDVDSRQLDAFSEDEATLLLALMKHAFDRSDIRW